MAKNRLHKLFFLPEQIDGIALDNDDTEKCHQLISVYYDQTYQSYRLNYALTCPDFLREAAIVPKEFAQNAYSDDALSKRKATAQYDRYYRGLMFGQTCFEGFSEDIYKPALVFSYLFNEKNNYGITDSFVTYGTARIKDQLDYSVINKMKDRRKIDPETRMWYDVMIRQDIAGTRKTKDKHSVQSAMEKTSVLTKRTARDQSVQHGIDGLFVVQREALTPAFSNQRKRNVVSSGDLIDQNVDKAHWDMPITNCNTDVALLNSGLMHYFLRTGRNLMGREKVGALARIYHFNANKGKVSTLTINRDKPFDPD